MPTNETIGRNALSDGAREMLLVFRIYDPSNREEPLVLNMPWDGIVVSGSWQLDAGSYNFEVEIDDGGGFDPITWTTATALQGASSTAADNTTDGANTFSAGDTLQISIGTVTGTPTYMQLELLVRVNKVNA